MMDYFSLNREFSPEGRAVSQHEMMDCVERLIQSCAVPTFVLDREHRVILWNRACEALTGVEAAQVIGTSGLGQIFYGFERPVLADYVIEGNLQEIEDNYEVHTHSLLIPDGLQAERWYTDKSGRERYIFFDAAPIRNSRGETIAAIETIQDITERKLAEEKLQKTASHLREINEEIRSFAYIVSHDLRAPLVNLKGFSSELELIMKELTPLLERCVETLEEGERKRIGDLFRKELPEALEFIGSSADRMDRLLNGILKLSRLGVQELKPEPVDTGDLVRTVLRYLAHQIEERNAVVTVGALPEVTADRAAMEQVFGNLMDNAVKFLAPDRQGRIEITAETTSDMTVFHIVDNGRGISENEIEKIFEIFRRAGRQDIPGEGVGLAYVKTLIRRHGGRIWCVSEPGRGSTFSFSLPRVQEQETQGVAGNRQSR
jgi:PAS domain S-box-containing protein